MDTVVEQLGSFRIDKFENRKDEVGLLWQLNQPSRSNYSAI